MANINKVFISGNVVADCEKKQAGETPIIEFTVAVNESRRNKQTNSYDNYANFIDCTMFGSRAKSVSNSVVKGTKVFIEGHLRHSRWEKDGEKRSKVSIIVDELEFNSYDLHDNAGKHAQTDEIPWD